MQGTVHHNTGSSERVLSSAAEDRGPGEDRLHHTPGEVSISTDALWTQRGAVNIPETNGYSVGTLSPGLPVLT